MDHDDETLQHQKYVFFLELKIHVASFILTFIKLQISHFFLSSVSSQNSLKCFSEALLLVGSGNQQGLGTRSAPVHGWMELTHQLSPMSPKSSMWSRLTGHRAGNYLVNPASKLPRLIKVQRINIIALGNCEESFLMVQNAIFWLDSIHNSRPIKPSKIRQKYRMLLRVF